MHAQHDWSSNLNDVSTDFGELSVTYQSEFLITKSANYENVFIPSSNTKENGKMEIIDFRKYLVQFAPFTA